MRIAVALFNYYPFGGLEQDCLAFIKHALHEGHDVSVYTQSWQGDVPEGMDLTILQPDGLSNHGRCDNFAYLFQKIVSPDTADVVIGFNRMPGLDVYFNADVSFVAKAAQHGLFYKLTPRYRTFARLERAVFDRNSQTHILSIAPSIKQEYQTLYQLGNERFTDLPPGINRQAIDTALASDARTHVRAELKLSAQDFLFLMVGSDYQRKGVDRAIEALAALPNEQRAQCKLAVIGKGKNERISPLIEKLGVKDQVILLGPRSDVPDYLAAADVFIHSARSETAGNAILEALVAGLPVIVTACCGFAWHIQAANAGIVIPDTPYDQGALDAALFEAMDTAKRRNWQNNARAYRDTEDLYSRPLKILACLKERADADNG